MSNSLARLGKDPVWFTAKSAEVDDFVYGPVLEVEIRESKFNRAKPGEQPAVHRLLTIECTDSNREDLQGTEVLLPCENAALARGLGGAQVGDVVGARFRGTFEQEDGTTVHNWRTVIERHQTTASSDEEVAEPADQEAAMAEEGLP